METKYTYSKDEYDRTLMEYKAKGYELESCSSKSSIFSKPSYGNFGVHLFLLIFTVSYTYGLLNLAYIIVSYLFFKDHLLVTLEDKKEDDDNGSRYEDVDSINDYLHDSDDKKEDNDEE